jgi:hypothetical protein
MDLAADLMTTNFADRVGSYHPISERRGKKSNTKAQQFLEDWPLKAKPVYAPP